MFDVEDLDDTSAGGLATISPPSTGRFGPGNSFFIEQGESVVWHVHETVTKSFTLHSRPV